MARGMVIGEAIVSQAQTRAFDENWDRMEHHDDGRRGRFVWDGAQQKLVRAEDYRPPEAKDAPIMAGRFYENTQATDGSDIGSRSKHRAYMRAHGVTTADDYKSQWQRQETQREERRAGRISSKTRREALERKFWEIQKP